MDLPSGLPIPQEDWERTPISVQVVLITLWQVNGSLKPQATMQQEQIARLERELAR